MNNRINHQLLEKEFLHRKHGFLDNKMLVFQDNIYKRFLHGHKSFTMILQQL